ncbi:minor capsid protein C from bacteriophage origin [Escherichia coli]|nr:minor capsid protein C from bacteriophage origin [Escherichia coli]
MAFNEPLMLEPAYARVFFCALAGQLGISRLTDAVSGDSLTAGEAPAALALSVDDDGPRQARSYQVMNGIAVLPVSGTLVSRTRALQPYSGMTSYNGIIARLQQAASDPMVDGILLDMDTPGGMVAGAFDCADIIARVRDIKPVCVAGRLRANLPVVEPYYLRNRTALNRTPTAPAHPVRIWGRKPHRRLITALNPRITLVRIPIV